MKGMEVLGMLAAAICWFVKALAIVLTYILTQVYILHKHTCVRLFILPIANVLAQVYNEIIKGTQTAE